MSHFDLMIEQARERLQMPAEWRWYRSECFPGGGHPTIYFEIRGCVPTLLKSGPNKGKPSFKRPVPGTDKTICLTVVECDAYVAAWEAKTGKCAKCDGAGKELCGAGPDGTRYRECGKCKGTGAAPGQGGRK